MPIETFTAYRDSYGEVHDTLIDAQVGEVMGVYYEKRPPTDEELDSYYQNELTRWAAEGIVKKLSRIVKAVYGEEACIISSEQINEFQQIMAETQPSHESRMGKALAALGFDYSDPAESMPDSYSDMKAAEALRSFCLIHVDGAAFQAPVASGGEYSDGYMSGVQNVLDHLKECVEVDLEYLGLKP